MKLREFEVSIDLKETNATFYFDEENSDSYLYLGGIGDTFINQGAANWSDIAYNLRVHLHGGSVDAQVTIVYPFEGQMKVVITVRDSAGVTNFEFWCDAIENCID